MLSGRRYSAIAANVMLITEGCARHADAEGSKRKKEARK